MGLVKQKTARNTMDWDYFEVFAREEQDGPLFHLGSVSAPNKPGRSWAGADGLLRKALGGDVYLPAGRGDACDLGERHDRDCLSGARRE